MLSVCLFLSFVSFVLGIQEKPVFDQLILVEKGDKNACVFEHFEELRRGEEVPLTLSSHPGFGVVKQYDHERRFGEWRYIESRGDDAAKAIRVKYEEFTFLKLATDDLVFDVAFWNMQPGTSVNFVGGPSNAKTYLYGGGKDFIINDDGTISCKHVPNLVLGFETQRVVNDFYIGPFSSNYEEAKEYCEENGDKLAEIYNIVDQNKAKAACGKHSCWINFIEEGGDEYTPQMQQRWKWENNQEVSYINWAPGEPNNYNEVDERNAILNCCGEVCTVCNGEWYDAPKEYNQPRPLCYKAKYALQYKYNNDEDEGEYSPFNESTLLKLAAIVVAGAVMSLFILVRYKVFDGTSSYYRQVGTTERGTHEIEAEMVTPNPAIATATAPTKLILQADSLGIHVNYGSLYLVDYRDVEKY